MKNNFPAVVILGGGPAGLAAALPLGRDAIVLEQKNEIGGLSCSFELHGVTFDLGGHSFHTPHPEIRELVFNALEMFEQQREARCYAHGALIPYPFQKYFFHLPDERIVAECKKGLRSAGSAERAGNFESYLYQRFGAGIAENFLLGYNRKLWGDGLDQLSTDWVGERIAKPAGENDVFQNSGGKRGPLTDGMKIAYPARGGFGEITKALARRVRNLRFGTGVHAIDPVSRTAAITGGQVISWRRLISTLPLDRLLRIIAGVPGELRARIDALQRVSLKLVCLVINRPVETPIQRIYGAEREIVAHKIGIANNSSDFLRRLPRCGVFGEVAYAPGQRPDEAVLQSRFAQNLEAMGLVQKRHEIIGATTIDMPYAYPVPTLDRAAAVDLAKEWLEERGIYSVGRFGEWAYINSDEAMFRGLDLGRRLAGEA